MSIFYEFVRTAIPAVSPTRVGGADLCMQPVCSAGQYFGYWRQPPATYPVVGYPSQWSLQNNGFAVPLLSPTFLGMCRHILTSRIPSDVKLL
ncbi:hypothetical protein BASA81_018038 [Batrachochytrium salamandrivorans]|nr:hypothetical protein BASA81_018038 [Batrachochytrium salamandrivorans]